MDNYNMIFRRKSFHLFRDNKTKRLFKDDNEINKLELDSIYDAFNNLKPLVKDIAVDIRIVENELTTCKRGQEYCILFYSEMKENYLQNIGFIGEQLDLYLASKNIGALWYGVGKTELLKYNNLDFVTMMAIGKVPESYFRKDMYKSKRKPIEEVFKGEKYLDVIDIARFAPSSCNTQPWFVDEKDDSLFVYRYKKPGKRGIMPLNKVVYQNLIDIGIFILFLDVILNNMNITHTIELKDDNEANEQEYTLAAIIKLDTKGEIK